MIMVLQNSYVHTIDDQLDLRVLRWNDEYAWDIASDKIR